jgi:hypothetical protein
LLLGIARLKCGGALEVLENIRKLFFKSQMHTDKGDEVR